MAARHGLYNSSLTRVRPFFSPLLAADPTGRSWLPRLLAACPNAERIPRDVRDDPSQLRPDLAQTRKYKDKILGPIELENAFEYSVPPPDAFLRYLLSNPDQLTWPTGQADRPYSPGTERRRRALVDGPAGPRRQAIAEGLDELRRVGPRGANARPKPWWSFEGYTEVDFYCETDKVVLFVEGKRTEALSDSTSWFPGRNQLVRNLEAAAEIASTRPGGVLLVCEEALPDIGDEVYERSLPHLNEVERATVRQRYLGQTTWRALCEALDVPFSSLPKERGGVAPPKAP